MRPGTARPWIAASSGVVLTVRLTPKGGRDAIDGIEQMSDGRAVLKVRVRAAPFEGQANDALLQAIASALGVPPKSVALVSGATARIKRLTIAGDAVALSAALDRIAGAKP
jgi:uncharacterized protein (TIGR00251 family)